jgi:hypothetical protein
LAIRRRNPWLHACFDAWSLGIEATSVVALRSMKLAAGGVASEVEAARMVSEKVNAGLALQMLAVTGGLGTTPHGVARKTLAHYRRKVRANIRRLTKP